MPNQPTQGTQPAEVLREFRGLNDQNDSVKRPPGTVSDMRNMYDETASDANRRPGRILQSLDDGNPIGIIYQLSWSDGFISNIAQSGSDFNFNTLTNYQAGVVTQTFTDPCADGITTSCPPGSTLTTNPITSQAYCADDITGAPLCPPPMPSESTSVPARADLRPVPDYVPIIRAMSEAFYFAKKGVDAALQMPAQVCVVAFYQRTAPFTQVASGIRFKPEFSYWFNRGFVPRITALSPIVPSDPYTAMELDHYYVDYVMQGPARFATTDLNELIHKYNQQILPLFLKTDPNASPETLSNYTSADFFTFAASPENYKIVCAQFAGLINSKLSRVKVAAAQSNLMTKTGTASDAPGACYTSNISVSGYSDVFFTIPGACRSGSGDPSDCSGLHPNWDGSMIYDADYQPGFCSYLDNPSGLDENSHITQNSCSAALLLNLDIFGDGLGAGFRMAFLVYYTVDQGSQYDVVWYGFFATAGTDPRGVYVVVPGDGITGGCTSSPATITIV